METGLDIKDELIVPKDVNPGGGLDQNFRELSAGAGSDLFKVNRDGVFIGATNFADAPFSIDFQGNVTLGDGTVIKSGQTAYNTGTGYWIGRDGGTPKFSIGNGSDKYLTWDGSALTIRGTLNADDIIAGTLTGRNVQATSATSGANIKLDATNKRISFLYDNVEKGLFYVDSNGDVFIDADNTLYLNADGAGDDILINAGGGISLLSETNVDGDLNVDGEVTATGGYSDFAEMFEATEEFASQKIPAGTSVVLVDEKIRPAKQGEEPIGVISGIAGIVLGAGGSDGNTAWSGKYLKDEFGQFI